MNDQTALGRRARISIGAALMLAASASAQANVIAEPRALPVRGTAVSTPAIHHAFGWLVSVNGNMIALQLRNGRLLQVNAAQAAALKHVSAPLFRGKPVVVTGTFGGDGVLYATSVTRAVPHSAAWGADR